MFLFGKIKAIISKTDTKKNEYTKNLTSYGRTERKKAFLRLKELTGLKEGLKLEIVNANIMEDIDDDRSGHIAENLVLYLQESNKKAESFYMILSIKVSSRPYAPGYKKERQ